MARRPKCPRPSGRPVRHLWTGCYGQDVRYAARGQDARSRDGQDVRYAARGQDARSRDGQEVRYAARGHACMDAGGRRRREQAVEEARSCDGQEVRYAARGQDARSRPAKAEIQACMDGSGRAALACRRQVWNEGRGGRSRGIRGHSRKAGMGCLMMIRLIRAQL